MSRRYRGKRPHEPLTGWVLWPLFLAVLCGALLALTTTAGGGGL